MTATPARRLEVDMEPLMAATRTINAIIVKSLATVDESLSVPELRVLVILAGHDAANLSDVAADLGVNPSNASRTCERLVQRKLVTRRTDAADRRRVELRLSAQGKRLLARVMDRRQRLLEDLVSELDEHNQQLLMSAMEVFNGAALASGVADHQDSIPSRLAPWLG